MMKMKNNPQDDWDILKDAAWKAREQAYAPYSGFKVGAAVQTASGHIYGGCNVENVSYGLCNCAERTAMFQAVANGERDFRRIVVCADTLEPIAPCGACRQVMQELGPQMEVLLINRQGKQIITSVAELLPYSFQDFPQTETPAKGDM